MFKGNSKTDFSPKDYWEYRLKNDYGLNGVGYARLGKNYNNWLYKLRRYVFLRKMRSISIDSIDINYNNTNILDIGSGTGFYIDRWKELGVKSITGIDITAVAVEKLKLKYLEDKFYQLDIGSNINCLGYSRYDIVSAFDVLFHIVDDDQYERAIKNIHSVLKPNGLFVFSEFFLHHETERASSQVKHQVSRSLDDIEKLLSNSGFEIIDRSPMLFFMNKPIDSRSEIFKKSWLSLSFIISINELFGYVFGAILYPIDLFCVSSLKESPTTEIMICRKK